MQMHLVTPEQIEAERIINIASCMYSDVTAIHIRQKSLLAHQIELLARQLLHSGIPASKLVLNEHYTLAAQMELGGTHLPEHVPLALDRAQFGLRIGRSVHSLEAALAAEREGCDYVFFGHVYATTCKLGIAARGLVILEQLCDKLRIPVIAIGGIKPEHVGELQRAGASGIAVMSGIFAAEQPQRQLERYREQLARYAVSTTE
ncbi:thiamine phosphate synthase [Paenibacillus sp. SGZ-1009]|uniref:thiamine phosphate synthase n=1 Tax=Paenibacillus campi TaxID=3106031 RepID=UPI002AFE41C0|nr:thiamine phosphate synthase [Paenibacillus sp. SGZ-1009]